MATRGKSAREVQEEIEGALRTLRRQKARRPRWVKVSAAVLALLALPALAVWLGLLAFHLGAGASPGDAVRMTFDDARVATRCPQEYDTVLDFLTRPESLPLSSLPDTSEARALRRICDGGYDELAPQLLPP